MIMTHQVSTDESNTVDYFIDRISDLKLQNQALMQSFISTQKLLHSFRD